MPAQASAALDVARSAESSAPDVHVVLLVAADYIVGTYLPLVMDHVDPFQLRGWRQLSWAPFDHRFTRAGPRTLELEVVDGVMMRTLFEELWRGRDHPLVPGMMLDWGLLRAEILDARDGPQRGWPFTSTAISMTLRCDFSCGRTAACVRRRFRALARAGSFGGRLAPRRTEDVY